MELHGGSVDVQPNTPQGAVFRLWLPQGQWVAHALLSGPRNT